MIRVQDVRSVTDFYRHANAHVKRLKQTGRPELLTINGKAVLVVQTAAAYQRLLDLVEKLQSGRRRKSR